jgi:hypothetical protein
MADSSSFTFKKSHVYIFLTCLGLLFFFLLISKGGNVPTSDTGLDSPAPSPTISTVVGTGNGSDIDTQSQLDEIREQNCRISQDLMFQYLDLSRQADELDWASDGFDNFDEVQALRNQAMNLLIKSQELGEDC